MTPAQCRAARALIGMSLNELAGNAVVPQGVIMAYEAGSDAAAGGSKGDPARA
jgi:hypothetical protein